jgi:hypothetical protein
MAADNGAAKVAEKKVEKSIEKPIAKAPEKAAAKPVQKTVEIPAAKPVQKAVEIPAAKPVQKAVEIPAAKPAQKSAEIPAAKPAQKSVEIPAAKPVVNPDDILVDITTIDNKKIAIPDKQFRRLAKVRSSGVVFLYPTSVPARFKLKHIRVLDKDPKHLEYRATFSAKKRSSFTIATAYSGIGGGPAGSRTISGYSKEFGPFKVRVFKPRTEGNKSKNVYYLSEWLKLKRKQSKDAIRYYHFFGTGVTDAESIAIVRSLTPIK